MHSVFFSVTVKISFLLPEFCVSYKSANCLQTTTSTRFAIKRGRCRPPRRGVCGDPEWNGWQLDAKQAARQQHTITQAWGEEGAAPELSITKHLKLRAFCSSVHTSWGTLHRQIFVHIRGNNLINYAETKYFTPYYTMAITAQTLWRNKTVLTNN